MIILLYLLFTEKSKWVKNKNIWIAVVLAVLVLTPWMIRNLGVCEYPFCEISRGVATIAPSTGEGGIQFELFNWVMGFPTLISLPVFILFLFGLILSISKREKGDILMLLWFIVFLIVLTQIGGAGAQLRRVLILVPPMILFASRGIFSIADEIKGNRSMVAQLAIILIITVPLMFFSAQQGQEMIISKAPAFLKLKDAGTYLQPLPADTKILANSLNQVAFYSGGKNTTNYFPESLEQLPDTIKTHDYDYVVIDGYEVATAPQWIFSFATPEYLSIEKTISQDGQLVVIIFKANKNLLKEKKYEKNNSQHAGIQ